MGRGGLQSLTQSIKDKFVRSNSEVVETDYSGIAENPEFKSIAIKDV